MKAIDTSSYPPPPVPNKERRSLKRNQTVPSHPSTAQPIRMNSAFPRGYDLEKVCSEFSSLFTSVLMKSMRSTIPKSSLFKEESQGKKIIEATIDQNMAQYLSSQRGFGLKELLLRAFMAKDFYHTE
ncbi:MAG: rod-binding protein [bacterium]